MGSSLKICLVAEGKADIYPRLALTSEWDTGAAQAILEAAGGLLTDADFNIYRYNQKEDILNPFSSRLGIGPSIGNLSRCSWPFCLNVSRKLAPSWAAHHGWVPMFPLPC